MLLAIDIGNSNATLGAFRDGDLVAVGNAPGTDGRDAAAVERAIDALAAASGMTRGDVAAVVLASVVPDATAAVTLVARDLGVPLLVATADTVPIQVAVDTPGAVGPDRLVNALAAARLHGGPAIVADFGTATTIDAIAGDGTFLGGAIAPGIVLGLDALAAGTARLPHVAVQLPDRAIGRSTAEAIESGTVLGHVAMAEGLIARIREELAGRADAPGGAIRVIATGGLSRAPWVQAVRGVDVIDPDLTLKGLAILHAEVAGGTPLGAMAR